MFSFSIFIHLIFAFDPLWTKFFSYEVREGSNFTLFACDCWLSPSPFVENSFFFPYWIVLHCCRKSINHRYKGFFRTLRSILWIYVFILLPVPDDREYYSLFVFCHFWNWERKAFQFVFLFQDCFGHSECFAFSYEIFQLVSFCKKWKLNFNGDYAKSVNQLGKIAS